MTRSISTCTLIAGCLTAIFACGTASADLVVTDPDNRVTLTVSSAPSPSPVSATHTTYTFTAAPIQGLTEITSIDGTFLADSPGTMRQVQPAGPTVFQDANGFFGFVGEDTSGLGDSQFEFNSATGGSGGGALQVAIQSEDNSSLTAAFTGFPGIQSGQTIAHIVLPNGLTGTADIEFVVREIGVGGLGNRAAFTGISFGATAIPEVSPILALPCLGILLAIPSYVASKRRRTADKQSIES